MGESYAPTDAPAGQQADHLGSAAGVAAEHSPRLAQGPRHTLARQPVGGGVHQAARRAPPPVVPRPRRHLDEEAAMEGLDPRKDVDGFHPLNMGWVGG